MKYYTYEEVKELTTDNNIIVLFTVVGSEYIGTAQNDKLYKIRNDHNCSKYTFLICTKSTEGNKELLVPIGYSDKGEWLKQEREYISEQSESSIMDICKNMRDHLGRYFWENIYKKVIEDWDDIEDIKDDIISNYMLYKVVKKCYEEDFPIQEYMVFEIPYIDNNGWIMDFVHEKEYNDYHAEKMKDVKIREIDFWVEKNGEAIPQFYNPKTGNQSDAIDCKSAVWTE